jgi:hypothetical protein
MQYKVSIQSAWAECCCRWFKYFSVSETDSVAIIRPLTLLNTHTMCQVISQRRWWRCVSLANCGGGGGGASETSDATVSPSILYWILSLGTLQDIYPNWINVITAMKMFCFLSVSNNIYAWIGINLVPKSLM